MTDVYSPTNAFTGPAIQALIDGRGFLFSEKFTVAAGPVLDILMQIGSMDAAFGVDLVVEGDLDMFFFEGVTFSAVGTIKTTINRNRESAATFSGTVSEGPTIISDGTLLAESFIPAGSRNQSIGGFSENRGIILAANTDYLFRVDNTSGGNQDVGLGITFVEDVG